MSPHISGESGRLMTQRYREKYLIDTDEILPPEVLKDLDLAFEVSARINHQVPCEGCGVCCHQRRITLQDHEPSRIASSLGLSDEEFCQEYLVREEGRWFLRITSPCFFLSPDNRCRIQTVKPEICGDAPFLTTQFIEAAYFLLRNQREGLILPVLGNFIMDDSPCSRKAAAIISDEISIVLNREKEGLMVQSQEQLAPRPV